MRNQNCRWVNHWIWLDNVWHRRFPFFWYLFVYPLNLSHICTQLWLRWYSGCPVIGWSVVWFPAVCVSELSSLLKPTQLQLLSDGCVSVWVKFLLVQMNRWLAAISVCMCKCACVRRWMLSCWNGEDDKKSTIKSNIKNSKRILYTVKAVNIQF